MKYKRPSTRVRCKNCTEEFYKEDREIKRSEKLGRGHFCNQRCALLYGSKTKYGSAVGFGFYVTLMRKNARHRDWSCDIDPAYLKKLFDKQAGLCAITGIPMVMNRARASKVHKTPFYASVDRIDNSVGYIRGNVQFVCLGINYLRNSFSIEKTKEFIEVLRVSQPAEYVACHK